jgi:uncharacterized protein YcgL (UPF0745 family)
MSFQIEYNGHGKNARKAIMKLGLATEKELALMNDNEVEDLINKSDYFAFKCEENEGYALVHKKYEKEIIWIGR